jgi:hypothetical protein
MSAAHTTGSPCRMAVQTLAIWGGEAATARKTLDQPSPFVYSYWTVRASHDPRLTVGLIGLGNMGTAFAERLLDAGYPLVVSNRTREKADALGEVDVVANGDRYTLRPGDVFWTGTGCVHAFYETQGGPVRWLETSAPGPPPRHSYWHERDWDYLAERLASDASVGVV